MAKMTKIMRQGRPPRDKGQTVESQMKLWTLRTTSESGDDYSYKISHPTKPTNHEIMAFLIEHGRDVDHDEKEIYEHPEEIEEVTLKKGRTISKVDLTGWKRAGFNDLGPE